MKLTFPRIRDSLLLAAMVATVASGNPVRAQHSDDTVEDAEDAVTGQETIGRTAEMQLHAALRRSLYSQFNHWVRIEFGTRAKVRERLDGFLVERLNQLELHFSLAESQRKKLIVAAEGDIKRFLDRLDRFAKASESDDIDRIQFHDLSLELRDLKVALVNKVFDTESLFTKTIVNTLDPEQRAVYQNRHRDQMAFLYRSAIAESVKSLGGVLELKKEQIRRLEKVLVEETRPPRKFGQSDWAFVMFQASKLPEAKLKPIFNESQWRWLSAELVSWSTSAETLKAEGFVLADESIGAPDPVARREKAER